jgi:hypothetical protein
VTISFFSVFLKKPGIEITGVVLLHKEISKELNNYPFANDKYMPEYNLDDLQELSGY